MKRLAILFLVLGGLLVPLGAAAQQPLVPTAGPASNQVQVLDAAGDSLWSGPLLTVYLEPDDRPRPADSLLTADVPALTEEDNVVFALAAANVAPDRLPVWAGLAFNTGRGVAGAGGFLVSTDGGQTFDRREAPLDAPEDTTVTYGVSSLPAQPVTQPANSAPLALALDRGADTAWVAGNRSGLRWSADGGRTWTRAVLPPDTLRSITPDSTYDFLLSPPQDDGSGFQNHVVLSTLVDETGTVWAGTPVGVNRSIGATRPAGARAWRRFEAGPAPTRLTGNTVVALAEQPRPGGRNPIWMATWAGSGPPAGQRFGITVTPDGGDTFRKVLVGERIFDIAARRNRIYAAGETGLFVSDDQGETWRSVTDFRLRSDNKVLPADVTPRAVTTTPDALWLGTTDGLLRLDRAEEPRLLAESPTAPRPRWGLLRTQVPVNPTPEQESEQVPDVATYAYPNPFVRPRDQLVRIVYELEEPRTVEVSIYDFGMNRVWSTTERKPAGQQETAWDGTDAQGLRVPTGTYMYTVDLGGETVRGKIVLTN